MTRQAFSSDRAPAALGPYSQAIIAGGFVFCSGTAGIDPATGVAPEGIEAQTDQALRNVAAILEAAGASMADIVKTTIFYARSMISRRSTPSTPGTCPVRHRRARRLRTSISLAGSSFRSRP